MNKYLNYLNDKYFKEFGFEEIESKSRNAYYTDLIKKNKLMSKSAKNKINDKIGSFILISVDGSKTYQSIDHKKLSKLNSELYKDKGRIINYSEYIAK